MQRPYRIPLLLLLVVTALAWAGPVSAQTDPLSVRVREAQLAPDGGTRVVVSVTGPATDGQVLGAGDLAVLEGGVAVDGVEVTPLLEDQAAALAVMLVIDVSGSTVGEPIAAAKAAATAFATEFTAAGGLVGLVSFGETAQLLTPLTTDPAPVRAAIEGLVAEGETALYDGVAVATDALAEFDGIRNMIVFSDGADTVSATTLGAAVSGALDIEAPVTTVALATEALDPAAIAALADGTGGRVIEADDSGSLAAAFDTAAAAVASQYVLTYTATPVETADLDLTVTATVAGDIARDVVTVTNPRIAISAGPAPAVIVQPLTPAEPWVLWAGLGAAFAAILTLVTVLVVAVRSEGESRRLKKAFRVHTNVAERRRQRDFDPAALSRRAGELIDHLPMPAGFDSRLQKRIDRAAWPLRATEFLSIQIAAGIAGSALAWALTGSLVFVPVGLIVGAFAPRVVLDRKVSARSGAFMEQLPDTLGLLAGSLKAGYGLVQAIDTVVREASPPTSEEFARVLTETRLGMPLAESLQGMAERLESEDFGWVVMAINIQAEVGGNLAHLLETVADTLRGREQVRRQVRTLSAEGKLSAYVLLGLVPAMALYMFAVNPSYMSLLWTTSLGRSMLIVGGTLLLGGVIGIKKVINIDV
ncbi:MAG: type II secretion system F family protein [Actinobacteria bacterium]|nr:type II secretion system F family protein [Actinomycetota bacterium]